MRIAAFFLMATCVMHSQVTAVRPLSGYIFASSSGTVHRIQGVPGSAVISPAVVQNLQKAWPAPEGAVALGVRDGVTLLLSRLDEPESVKETSEGLLSGSVTAAWSPRARLAVLVGAGQLQVIRFGSEPSFDTPIETTSLGTVTAAAVNDVGQVVLASSDGLYVWSSSGFTPLNDTAGVKNMQFAGDELYVATQDEVLRVSLGDGAAQVLTTGAAIAGFGVARVSDRLYVADSRDRAVHMYSRSGEKLVTLPVDVAPATFQPILRDSVFLLNAPENSGASAIVLQASEQLSVFFVPADPSSL